METKDMDLNPSVSVVIPAYNIEKYLAQTLESIFSQTIQVTEVIVINDGSTDRSVDIARAFGATIYEQENRGLSAARNAGAAYATSSWIAFLDGDDLWAPQKLSRQLDAIASDSSSGFIFSDFWQFDSEHTINYSVAHEVHGSFTKLKRIQVAPNIWRFDQDDLATFIPRNCLMVPSTWMVKRDLFLEIGGCDETLRYSEDIELELRLLARTAALFVDESLVGYRKHGSAMTANQLRMRRGDIDVAKRVYSKPSSYLDSTVTWFDSERATILRKGGRMAVIYGEGIEARKWLSESLSITPSISTLLWFAASHMSGNRFVTPLLQLGKRTWFKLRTVRTRKSMRSR